MAVMRTAAKISRQPIGKWDMGGNKMIAITACAAALAAVTALDFDAVFLCIIPKCRNIL